jgi:hypothetical protein
MDADYRMLETDENPRKPSAASTLLHPFDLQNCE